MFSKLSIQTFFIVIVMLWSGSIAFAENTPLIALDSKSDLAVALSKLSNLKGFSSQFKQKLTYAEGGSRAYEGELFVLRPGKFRWHYSQPYEQLYVSNGKGIWLYEPDLMQAQLLQDLGEVEPVVLQLLDGRVGLEDVQVLGEEHFGAHFSSWHVRLGKANAAVEIWLGVQDQKLLWIESRDVLNNRNRLQLVDIKQDEPNKKIFEFIAPEGVDVIGAIQ